MVTSRTFWPAIGRRSACMPAERTRYAAAPPTMRPTSVRPAIVARLRRRSATAPVSLGARPDPSGFGERATRFLTDGFLACRWPGPSNEMVRAIMGSSQGAPEMKCRIRRAAAAACVIALGFVSTASAQVFTGRVDVVDRGLDRRAAARRQRGAHGPGRTRQQVTDAQGQAHFLNLPVGTYAVKAELSGFNSLHQQHRAGGQRRQHAAVDEAGGRRHARRPSPSPRRRR